MYGTYYVGACPQKFTIYYYMIKNYIRQKLKEIAPTIITLLLILTSVYSFAAFDRYLQEPIIEYTEYRIVEDTSYVSYKDVVKDSIKTAVNEYIRSNSKTHGASEISESIVEVGLQQNLDICFMMAQSQLETNFGQYGIGKSRKSIFGVMSGRYVTYEHAVKDYSKILYKYYLTNGRTEQHLLNNYVTRGGTRYAANENYENELSDIYHRISRNTNIKELQKLYDEAEE